MSTLAVTYVAYLVLSVLVTVFVGRTLHHHGRPYLVDVFCGNSRLAAAANDLLLVGFYLVNVAYVMLTLKSGLHVETAREGFELLTHKLGVVLLTLGVMHFVNLIAFTAIHRAAARDQTG